LDTAQGDLTEKRERLSAMSLQEVGEYIMKKNPGTVTIDPITNVRNIYLHDTVLELPYYVSDGFLSKFTSAIESPEKTKHRVQKDTLNEDCRKTAFSVFLQKGGIMHYTYRLQKDTESEFLFDFNNTWEKCQE